MPTWLSFHHSRTCVLCLILLFISLTNAHTTAKCSALSKDFCVIRLSRSPKPYFPVWHTERQRQVVGKKSDIVKWTTKANTSSFSLHIEGVPSPSHTKALQYCTLLAAKEWVSLQNVRVKVSFLNQFGDPNTLGDARSTSAWYIDGFVYPVAMTKALLGSDVNAEDGGEDYYDIVIRLNANTPWYTGTDRRTSWDKFDLVTVCLHEMYHGLLVTGGGIEVSPASSGNSYDAKFLDAKYMWRFEAFLSVAVAGGRDCGMATYRGHATLLGASLTSNNLWFRSSGGRVAALHAPNKFENGSSIYHLSEAKYGEHGSSNNLLTPSMPTHYSIHEIGPLVKEMQRLMLNVSELGAPICALPLEPIVISDKQALIIGVGLPPLPPVPTPSATSTNTPKPTPSPTQIPLTASSTPSPSRIPVIASPTPTSTMLISPSMSPVTIASSTPTSTPTVVHRPSSESPHTTPSTSYEGQFQNQKPSSSTSKATETKVVAGSRSPLPLSTQSSSPPPGTGYNRTTPAWSQKPRPAKPTVGPPQGRILETMYSLPETQLLPSHSSSGTAPGRHISPSRTPKPSKESPRRSISPRSGTGPQIGCFPEHAAVGFPGAKAVPVHKVGVGAEVITSNQSTSEVFLFSHKDRLAVAEFLRLEVGPRHAIELSGDHFIVSGGDLIRARDLNVGDKLLFATGQPGYISRVSIVTRKGLYNPHTLDGYIVVDGFVVSTYTAAVDPSTASAILAPARAIYKMVVASAYYASI